MTDPIFIGVTGHRLNVLAPRRAKSLATELRNVLGAVSRRHANRTIIISALAEGADRLAAHAALALGLGLDVLLPFPRDLYRQDFSQSRSLAEFDQLLGRAVHITEMDQTRGSEADDARAYAACGAAMVVQSHLLVAVWDGKPARGQGGTAEVIDMTLAARKPVIWIDADHIAPAVCIEPSDAGRIYRRIADLSEMVR